MTIIYCQRPDGSVFPTASTSCPTGTKQVPKPASLAPTPEGKPAGGGTTAPSGFSGVAVPGPTFAPNQPANAEGWYSSPRPTTVPFDNIDNAIGGFSNLDAGWMQWIDAVAKYEDYRGTGRSLYEKAIRAVSDSNYSGPRLTPIQWIQNYAAKIGFTSPDGSISQGAVDRLNAGNGPSGPSGGSGSIAPQPLDRSSVRRAMDALAVGLIGRTLKEDEFGDYYKRYQADFRGNPDMDMQQHGIEALRQDDGYQEYQVATKFADALQSVAKGAM